MNPQSEQGNTPDKNALAEALEESQRLVTELEGCLPNENKKFTAEITALLKRRPDADLLHRLQLHNRAKARALVVATHPNISTKEFSVLFGNSEEISRKHGAALDAIMLCRNCTHAALTQGNVREGSGKPVNVDKILNSFRARYLPIMLPELVLDGFRDDPNIDRAFLSRGNDKKTLCTGCVDDIVKQKRLLAS